MFLIFLQEKVFLILHEMELSGRKILRLKNQLYFLKKYFSYILGNGPFQPQGQNHSGRNFVGLKIKKKNQPEKQVFSRKLKKHLHYFFFFYPSGGNLQNLRNKNSKYFSERLSPHFQHFRMTADQFACFLQIYIYTFNSVHSSFLCWNFIHLNFCIRIFRIIRIIRILLIRVISYFSNNT